MKRPLWEQRIPKIKWKKAPDYGDIFTIEHWIGNVEGGGFIDYDGFGQLGTEKEVTQFYVRPSYTYPEKKKIKRVCVGMYDDEFSIDEKFLEENKITHVCWYNR